MGEVKCTVCEDNVLQTQAVGINGRWCCPKKKCLDVMFAGIRDTVNRALRGVQ